jgi:hypothetical protein
MPVPTRASPADGHLRILAPGKPRNSSRFSRKSEAIEPIGAGDAAPLAPRRGSGASAPGIAPARGHPPSSGFSPCFTIPYFSSL